ncbi:hypothetical protein L3Q82_003217 [Scortum barcoo]|uniref:Uncharacterized protein n=1 Tax=Scortum barcoo TaxID=214431 RepID=A0ACB8VUL3_9TELE|nr:hypothetical protein L3Q82_003217 [Scortum barcoo]
MSSSIVAAPDSHLAVRYTRKVAEKRGDGEENEVEIFEDEEHHVDLGSQKANVLVTLEKEQLQIINDKLKNISVCPDEWKRFGRSCYFKSNEKKDWYDSRNVCQNKGAHLVIRNDKEEQVELLTTPLPPCYVTDEEEEEDHKPAKRVRLETPDETSVNNSSFRSAVWQSHSSASGRMYFRANVEYNGPDHPKEFVLQCFNSECGVFHTILNIPFVTWEDQMRFRDRKDHIPVSYLQGVGE